MPSTQGTVEGAVPTKRVLQLLFTTVAAIALGVLEEIADPFGLDTQTDQLSADVFNAITSPLYGRKAAVNLDCKHYSSRHGQSQIIVVLIDDAYLRAINETWPLDLRHYRRLMRKLVDAGASVIFVDIFFVRHTPERSDEIDSLYQYAGCLERASACGTASDIRECGRDTAHSPECLTGDGKHGTSIIFASTKRDPLVKGDEGGIEGQPAGGVALAQLDVEPNFYPLRQQDRNNDTHDSPGWAIYKEWCRRDTQCDFTWFDDARDDDLMYVQWGYAPNRMMTDEDAFGGGACIRQADTLLHRVLQSANVFRWNMIYGFHDGETIAPCPYTSQVNMQLLNILTSSELEELFDNRIALVGTRLDYYPDYQRSPIHEYVPGIFWHAMAVDNLIEFSGRFLKKPPQEIDDKLEAVGLAILFALQGLLTWIILRRQARENPTEIVQVKLDLLHGLLVICVISATVLWMTGFNRWAPANWIGFAMLMFLIDFKPIKAVPRFCWMILPTVRMRRRPVRFFANLMAALALTVLLAFAGFVIFILPHALILARELDDQAVSYTFLAAYGAVILLCAWKITLGRLR